MVVLFYLCIEIFLFFLERIVVGMHINIDIASFYILVCDMLKSIQNLISQNHAAIK